MQPITHGETFFKVYIGLLALAAIASKIAKAHRGESIATSDQTKRATGSRYQTNR